MTPFVPGMLSVFAYLPILVGAISAVYAATRYERPANILRAFWHTVPRVAGFLIAVHLFLAFLWLNLPPWIYAITVSALVLWIFAPQTLIRQLWSLLRSKRATTSKPAATSPNPK